MKPIFFSACFTIILNLLGCGKGPYYSFWVENNADFDIILHYNFINAKHIYPDTLFSIEIPADKRFIKAHSTSKNHYWAERLENIIKKIPQDTLSFFFFHSDSLDKYSIEIIQREYKILRRYDLSSQDVITLRNQHGNLSIIPYPPDERMKDMKMYPPYGSE